MKKTINVILCLAWASLVLLIVLVNYHYHNSPLYGGRDYLTANMVFSFFVVGLVNITVAYRRLK